VREITPRPFAVNHVVPLLDEAAFRVTLEAKPAGKASGRLFRPRAPGRASQSSAVERARGARAKVVHQVHTVGQARRAIELGVDVIIAQGSETGGQGMALGVGAMALIPQIAEAVGPIPVLAAGGVADGRGLAAALVLGAQGANVGTRFLACKGASADEGWKRTILGAESDHAVRFEAWGDVFPPAGGGAYATVPRVLRTPFVEEWSGRSRVGRKEAERLQDAVHGPRRLACRRNSGEDGGRSGTGVGARGGVQASEQRLTDRVSESKGPGATLSTRFPQRFAADADSKGCLHGVQYQASRITERVEGSCQLLQNIPPEREPDPGETVAERGYQNSITKPSEIRFRASLAEGRRDVRLEKV
jgi:NAD(P)H-dependent flavin oxidoreductase YrpB (nitropropane dioxygenase family)